MANEWKGGKYNDKKYIGQKFGRLTVIGMEWPPPENRLRWRVRCDCGVEKVMKPYNIVDGKTKSCGCYLKELKAERDTDGLHYKWRSIIDRCYAEGNPLYGQYGGRGISVCDEWKDDYAAFRAWAMENGWEPNDRIARRDTTGDYCPENCVCGTPKELAKLVPRKRSSTAKGQPRSKNSGERTVVYWGKERRLIDLCEEKGLALNTVLNRLKRGWTVEDAVDRKFRIRGMGVPARERGLDQAWIVTYYGEKWGLTALCKRKGIGYSTVVNRLKSGMRVEQAVDTPVGPYHRRKPTKKQRREGEEST